MQIKIQPDHSIPSRATRAQLAATPITLEFVVPSNSLAVTINPCYLPAAATTCAGGLGFDGQLKIDSTGSIWTTSGTTASLIQIIGAAAPQRPLARLRPASHQTSVGLRRQLSSQQRNPKRNTFVSSSI
jgi:hypothetical protein